MKVFFALTAVVMVGFFASCNSPQQNKTDTVSNERPDSTKPVSKSLYIDVHHLGPGNVNYEGVAEAHTKDIAVQQKYDVNFIKYWVDEARGDVYCLSSSADSLSVRKTHAEAHGLLPAQVYQVQEGIEASVSGQSDFFLDVHEFGAGKVSARDVAGAHEKDLAVQQKHSVNFINYWLNEKDGIVMCLSQAPDSTAVIRTHTEAHGLVPVSVVKVKQGQ